MYLQAMRRGWALSGLEAEVRMWEKRESWKRESGKVTHVLQSLSAADLCAVRIPKFDAICLIPELLDDIQPKSLDVKNVGNGLGMSSKLLSTSMGPEPHNVQGPRHAIAFVRGKLVTLVSDAAFSWVDVHSFVVTVKPLVG